MQMATKFDFQPEQCCKRPAIAVMDYFRHTADRSRDGEPRINRCCTNCWAHWFGEPGNVTSYTRREWDAYIADGWANESQLTRTQDGDVEVMTHYRA
jgi:hypothetical protein